MSAVGIRFNPLHETLQRVEKWETPDVEILLREVAGVLTRRKMHTLPLRESELLLQINQPAFSPEVGRRYKTLYGKLQSETIAESEHSDLLTLIQQQEAHNVKRLKNLIELAQIRNITLDNLMEQLGIETVASYA